MTEEEAGRLVDFVSKAIKDERQRVTLKAISRPIVAFIGAVTLLATLGGLILDGFSFFSENVPRAVSFIAQRIGLSDNFRSLLVDRLARQMAYDRLCAVHDQVVDFDGDGDRTDLIVEFVAPGPDGCAGLSRSAVPASGDGVYALFKEIEWTGIWPTYTLLVSLSKRQLGHPMSFQQVGRFLVGSPAGANSGSGSGTASPGVAVWGYANGTMHDFGKFPPPGARSKTPQPQPKALLGDKLLLSTDDGIMSLEITPAGGFVQKLLTASDLLSRNNATVVLEYGAAGTKSLADWGGGNYQPARSSIAGCDRPAFMNGVAVVFSRREKEVCLAEVQLARTSMVVANVPCLYEGFRQAQQFPWGWVYDPTAQQHSIRCPAGGGESGRSPDKLVVSIGSEN